MSQLADITATVKRTPLSKDEQAILLFELLQDLGWTDLAGNSAYEVYVYMFGEG